MAFADRAQLESAVLNLVLNAQDAMPAGGHLTLSTEFAAIDEDYRVLHPEVASGSYALISVTDDGEGMTPEVIEHAFEPFFTTKEVGKGSGLGLSMVYGFAKQSDGHVSIYSEMGLGTTVRIYCRAPARTILADVLESEVRRAERHETILIAEDDPFVRTSVIQRVEALGYRVVAAVNGKEAMQRLRTDPNIDMLFTDIVMPGGMSGWELADHARQLRPGLPVLFTSGYALETLVEQGRAHAQAIVLTKPYRKAELAQRLRDAFAAAVGDVVRQRAGAAYPGSRQVCLLNPAGFGLLAARLCLRSDCNGSLFRPDQMQARPVLYWSPTRSPKPRSPPRSTPRPAITTSW